jgi:N-acetylneuraminate synthase
MANVLKTQHPMFIAEVSSNHHRDLARSLAFVDTAAAIGCYAVKFQLFKVRELFAPEILARSASHQAREAWELPADFLPPIAERCAKRGIAFGCTPFYLGAVAELAPYVAFFKIASYELLWNELLIACAHTGKPVIISTGMATLEESVTAVRVLRDAGCEQLTVLHCVSGYPTPVGECNLAAIETLRKNCACPVGWSNHSAQPAVIHRAVQHWGASAIEFHLDLDGSGDEFRTGHCWLPEKMATVIADTRLGFTADGSGEKAPVPCELPDRDWRADPSDGLRPLLATRLRFAP